MSEDASARRKRLKALKDKAAGKQSIKFRNYRPQDAAIKDGGMVAEGSSSKGDEGGRSRRGANDSGDKDDKEDWEGKRKAPEESLIQQELKKQKETQDEEELNIAPKKANWDLKRDVEKKLEKLNRRTQRAIVEIIRERMAEEAANGSSSDGDGDGSSGSGSDSSDGSSSSGEEGSGSSSEDED